MIHENYNVADLAKSMAFYEEALGLKETRRKEAADGSFIIVYLANENSDFELELTWLRDMDRPYNLGDWLPHQRNASSLASVHPPCSLLEHQVL